ncbi:hypothetical protein L3Q82_017572 [Scortum barcoo]|uniref:Uncharacterized protein n=1 Tax=Scortum barcoo TaxID=214431 RepID=A0ACB8VPC6_9TELE|nr:hypothetical protein L3Q82_017572 [Scortum barcoo]
MVVTLPPPPAETGAIFTFGKSSFADNVPGKFWLKNDQPVHISCGGEHTAIITENGRLLMFGGNTWGQLGLGPKPAVCKPASVKALKSEKVKLVACGRDHTLVCTWQGNVYSAGSNQEGQLGLGHCNNTTSFHLLRPFCDHAPIKMLSAGGNTSAALTEDGRLFMWGDNSMGQVGLGDVGFAAEPREVDVGEAVMWVSCGYQHSAFVTVDGDLYTCGESANGRLGIQVNQLANHRVPQRVQGILGRVTQVSCGGEHTVVLTEESVYTFGRGQYGQLGHGTFLFEIDLPKPLEHFCNSSIKCIACGEKHTAVITDSGLLYTFGDGRHGKLGLGEENFINQFSPTLCTRFLKHNVQLASCGGNHMLVLAAPRPPESRVVVPEKEVTITEKFLDSDYTEILLLDTLIDPNPLVPLSARARHREKGTSGELFGEMFQNLPRLNSDFLNTSWQTSRNIRSPKTLSREGSTPSSSPKPQSEVAPSPMLSPRSLSKSPVLSSKPSSPQSQSSNTFQEKSKELSSPLLSPKSITKQGETVQRQIVVEDVEENIFKDGDDSDFLPNTEKKRSRALRRTTKEIEQNSQKALPTELLKSSPSLMEELKGPKSLKKPKLLFKGKENITKQSSKLKTHADGQARKETFLFKSPKHDKSKLSESSPKSPQSVQKTLTEAQQRLTELKENTRRHKNVKETLEKASPIIKVTEGNETTSIGSSISLENAAKEDAESADVKPVEVEMQPETLQVKMTPTKDFHRVKSARGKGQNKGKPQKVNSTPIKNQAQRAIDRTGDKKKTPDVDSSKVKDKDKTKAKESKLKAKTKPGEEEGERVKGEADQDTPIEVLRSPISSQSPKRTQVVSVSAAKSPHGPEPVDGDLRREDTQGPTEEKPTWGEALGKAAALLPAVGLAGAAVEVLTEAVTSFGSVPSDSDTFSSTEASNPPESAKKDVQVGALSEEESKEERSSGTDVDTSQEEHAEVERKDEGDEGEEKKNTEDEEGESGSDLEGKEEKERSESSGDTEKEKESVSGEEEEEQDTDTAEEEEAEEGKEEEESSEESARNDSESKEDEEEEDEEDEEDGEGSDSAESDAEEEGETEEGKDDRDSTENEKQDESSTQNDMEEEDSTEADEEGEEQDEKSDKEKEEEEGEDQEEEEEEDEDQEEESKEEEEEEEEGEEEEGEDETAEEEEEDGDEGEEEEEGESEGKVAEEEEEEEEGGKEEEEKQGEEEDEDEVEGEEEEEGESEGKVAEEEEEEGSKVESDDNEEEEGDEEEEEDQEEEEEEDSKTQIKPKTETRLKTLRQKTKQERTKGKKGSSSEENEEEGEESEEEEEEGGEEEEEEEGEEEEEEEKGKAAIDKQSENESKEEEGDEDEEEEEEEEEEEVKTASKKKADRKDEEQKDTPKPAPRTKQRAAGEEKPDDSQQFWNDVLPQYLDLQGHVVRGSSAEACGDNGGHVTVDPQGLAQPPLPASPHAAQPSHAEEPRPVPRPDMDMWPLLLLLAQLCLCSGYEGSGRYAYGDDEDWYSHRYKGTPWCAPIKVKHGDVSCRTPRGEHYRNVMGARCKIRCKQGYEVQSPEVVCMANKHWSSNHACREIRCPKMNMPMNGGYKCSDGSYFNSRCEFFCSPGFSLKGQKTATCQHTKAWSAGVPTCVDIEPPKIKCPNLKDKWAEPGKLTARVTWDTPEGVDTADGILTDVILKGKPSKSDFPEGLHKMSYTVFDRAGNKGSCRFTVRVRVRRCSPLFPPDNGYMKCDSDNDNYGATCNFKCTGGYELQGSAARVCQYGLTWSGTDTSCASMNINVGVRSAAALLDQFYEKRRLLIISAPTAANHNYRFQMTNLQVRHDSQTEHELNVGRRAGASQCCSDFCCWYKIKNLLGNKMKKPEPMNMNMQLLFNFSYWTRDGSYLTEKLRIDNKAMKQQKLQITLSLWEQHAQCGLDLRHVTVIELVGTYPAQVGRIRHRLLTPALALQIRTFSMYWRQFAAECEVAGMRISTSKSEAMVLDQKENRVTCPLRVGGEVLPPQVEEFVMAVVKYLGVLFT